MVAWFYLREFLWFWPFVRGIPRFCYSFFLYFLHVSTELSYFLGHRKFVFYNFADEIIDWICPIVFSQHQPLFLSEPGLSFEFFFRCLFKPSVLLSHFVEYFINLLKKLSTNSKWTTFQLQLIHIFIFSEKLKVLLCIYSLSLNFSKHANCYKKSGHLCFTIADFEGLRGGGGLLSVNQSKVYVDVFLQLIEDFGHYTQENVAVCHLMIFTIFGSGHFWAKLDATTNKYHTQWPTVRTCVKYLTLLVIVLKSEIKVVGLLTMISFGFKWSLLLHLRHQWKLVFKRSKAA